MNAFTSLPDEILLKILFFMNFQSLAQLYKTCKRFYFMIHNKKFGLEYLELEAPYLSSHVPILKSISQFDVFLFGYTSIVQNCCFAVHHSRSDSMFHYSDIYLVHASLTGKLKTKKIRVLGDYGECKIQHNKSCPICAILAPATVSTIINKQFIVFFQNWQDDIQITFPHSKHSVYFHCKHQPQSMYSVWRVADYGIHTHQTSHINSTSSFSVTNPSYAPVVPDSFLNSSPSTEHLQIYRFISNSIKLQASRIRSLLKHKESIVFEPWHPYPIDIEWFGLRRSIEFTDYMSMIFELETS